VANGPEPWLEAVRGEQIIPLISDDYETLRVAAGPGTGKTFGLCRRVLRLMHPDGEGVPGERILVCAFNRVIAADLREEIASELERFGLGPPVIQTVHALAASVEGRMPRFLLPQEVEEMAYDIRNRSPEIDQQYGRDQRRVLRALREHEAGLVSHPALATAVREWLTAHRADLIGELPRRADARIRGGGLDDPRYDHIVIDEFQDLTEVEARLLFALRAPGGSVTVLGDRKQSIYAFRGNEGKGLEAVEDLAPGAVHDRPMDECQRCSSEIVALANDVMAYYGEPLRDVRGPGAQIHVVHFGSPGAEHERIAQEAARAYVAHPEDAHLVLVTRRKWGYDVRDAIREVAPDVTAHTVFAEDVLETWPAREAFIFFSIAAIPDNAVSLRDWISYKQPNEEGRDWKAQKRNAPVYGAIWGEEGVLTLERAMALADGPETALSGSGRRLVHQRLRRLAELHGALPNEATATELVEHVFDPDRWDVANAPSPELAREDILRLRLEAQLLLAEDEDLSAEQLADALRSRIATREPLGQEEEPNIRIVTLWGAKGLTADFVYLVGLCDEALPGRYDPNATGLSAEEHELEQLRLLYVSLTRAKKALVISRPTRLRRGEVPALGLAVRPGYGYYQDLLPCRFFEDVPPEHLPRSVSGDDWDGLDL
jgi:superfamily I DNA/RNA helicase